jgi:hypothetical protein
MHKQNARGGQENVKKFGGQFDFQRFNTFVLDKIGFSILVLTNSFDKNSVKQRIDAFKEELKALVDHSDDIENVSQIFV